MTRIAFSLNGSGVRVFFRNCAFLWPGWCWRCTTQIPPDKESACSGQPFPSVTSSVGTGSERLSDFSMVVGGVFAPHCVALLFVACLPFLHNARPCHGVGGRHCWREMPTEHGHSSSHGDILFQSGTETSSLLWANASVFFLKKREKDE